MNTPAVCQYLSDADPIMAKIISRYPSFLIPIKQEETFFEALSRAVISQQLSGKAADAITKKFLALFNSIFPSPNQLLATTEDTLRTAGLSGQKARYLHHIAHFWIDHELAQHDFSTQNDEEIITLLTQIKGVGRWTVEMLLMFTLYRPDVFPIGDLGIRKSIAMHYDLDMTSKDFIAQATAIAQRWQPYRTVASRYLWQALDNR